MLLCVCVCVCAHTSFLPHGTHDQEPYMNFQVMLGLDTVFKHVSAQSNKGIAGDMAGQQQTLKISVHTLSKGYLKWVWPLSKNLPMMPLTKFSRTAALKFAGGAGSSEEGPTGDSEALFWKRLHPGDSKLASVNIEDCIEKWFRRVTLNLKKF